MTGEIQQILSEANIPALSLAVVERGKVVCRYAVGSSVSPETRFQVCCLGKPVTALAMLLLEEQGRLHLDDPACRYLPANYFPRPSATARSVTIRHLLSHAAGVPRGSFRREERGDEEYARELHDSEFVYPPGARYKFSNLGYFLCGAIIERVAETSFRAFIREQIFRALGMDSASFSPDADIAPGHSRGEYYALVHRDDALKTAPCFPLPAAAGGFYCTAEDYARFLAAVLGAGDGPVTARMRDQFCLAHMERAGKPGSGGGLGFQVQTSPEGVRLRHSGSNSGYGALVVGDACRAIGAVAFCNRSNAYSDLTRVLEVATGGSLARDPAQPLDRFSGSFARGKESLVMRTNGHGLWGKLGEMRFELRRKSAKSFIPEDGPFREYVMRFSFWDGRARACSAGPNYFSGDGAPVCGETPAPWRQAVGQYVCPDYATAEIFVRRNRLHCLCGPLHETQLQPLAPDIYRQKDGLFEGEPLRFLRSGAGRITSLEMGGMAFARLERL